MRLLEWLIALVAGIALTSAALATPHLMPSILIVLLVPLLAAHARFEGMHWQMVPIYLAALLLVPLAAVLPPWNLLPAPGSFRVALEIGVAIFLFGGLAICFALPMFRLMKPTGRYPIGTRTFSVTDDSRAETHPGSPPGRRREVVVQIWYPSAISEVRRCRPARYRPANETRLISSYHAVLRTDSIQDAPVAPGAFPVLLFNHAWGGFRSRSTFLTQELASHGFVVAAVSHPYNANITALHDGLVAMPVNQADIGFYADKYIPVAERLRIADEELKIQVEDCIFVLDELAARAANAEDPLFQHLRMDCVATIGHSYGGAVSIEFALEDARVRSALALDGVLHGKALHSGLNKPVMMIESSWLATPHGNVEDPDPVARETARLWALMHRAKQNCLTGADGCEVVIAGTNHENFTDMAFMSPLRKLSNAGPLPQRKAAAIISAYVVAFFRQTLLDEKAALLSAEESRAQEVTFTQWDQAEERKNL